MTPALTTLHVQAYVLYKEVRTVRDDPDFERPRIVGELDQYGALLRDLAPVLAAFHENLVACGFRRDEALELAGIVLSDLVSRGGAQP